jgi:hypothetical protein
MSAWRSHNHLLEAAIGIKATRNAIRDERFEDARVEHPEHFKRSAKTWRASTFQVGSRVGSLTLVDYESSRLGRLWRCRCQCGRERRALTAALNQIIRRGGFPSCVQCMLEDRMRQRQAARESIDEAFRKQFVDYRTLWLIPQVRRLQEDVLQDLEEAFGDIVDRGPSLRFGSFAPALPPKDSVDQASPIEQPSYALPRYDDISIEDVAPINPSRPPRPCPPRFTADVAPFTRGSGWSSTANVRPVVGSPSKTVTTDPAVIDAALERARVAQVLPLVRNALTDLFEFDRDGRWLGLNVPDVVSYTKLAKPLVVAALSQLAPLDVRRVRL